MQRLISISECKKNGRTYYGLKITEENETLHFHNISDNLEKVERLCNNLKNPDISSEHVKDIIRDFIVEDACDRLMENSLR